MWWIIVLAFLLTLFIYLLFAPFFVEIDTRQCILLRIRFHQVYKACLVLISQTFF